MLVVIKDSFEEMSREAAKLLASLVRRKPDCVLGFATGSTPLGMYKELIRLHKEEGLDFRKSLHLIWTSMLGCRPLMNKATIISCGRICLSISM